MKIFFDIFSSLASANEAVGRFWEGATMWALRTCSNLRTPKTQAPSSSLLLYDYCILRTLWNWFTCYPSSHALSPDLVKLVSLYLFLQWFEAGWSSTKRSSCFFSRFRFRWVWADPKITVIAVALGISPLSDCILSNNTARWRRILVNAPRN